MLRVNGRVAIAGSVTLLLLTGAWTAHSGGWLSRHAVSAAALDPTLSGAYKWRSIGPDRGGRSIAATGVRGRPNEAYFGATGGGLWKTTDGGENWAPVTDGQIGATSVGAVAVSESNPDIVFIGTGESCIRGNIIPGDGVYKSTDAGKTWTHIAFSDGTNISKIRIHPTNPDIVWVAVFGYYGGPNEERGVYKTADGGKTWRKVLYRDANTGAVDISVDTRNPNVLYAALWEAFRNEYTMSSGGPGSGLFKSTDGGETWTEITRNRGLPSGVVGRIGVAVSGADPNRVYALVENANGGLYASDDAGASWTLVNGNRNIRQRAFYYTHVFADPKARDVVYVQNTALFKSTDGGKTLNALRSNTHGDHHDLWIDPDDTQHLVDGNDGGGAVSRDGGQSFTEQDFPTAQFYHVITTGHIPFHVCGSQQDNTTACVSSEPPGSGRGGQPKGGNPLYTVGGGEPGYIAPDPKDIDVYFAGTNNGGFMTMYNRKTGQLREVNPYPRQYQGEPSSEVKERWQWTYPIIFSPVDSNILYTSSQRVWKTTNGGQNWEPISPDLSKHDPKTMGPSGGPITHDMNWPEIYAVVFALGPGKRNVDVIWAGTDDGLVHVTQDGGKTWTNVTPPDMPDLGRVTQIDASAFDDGTAYVAVKRPLFNDFAPYIFRTHDFGRTWTKIVSGIAPNDYTHTVREDPTRRGLLYAGTRLGVYISYDDGDNWESLRLNLPTVPVNDLWVDRDALVLGTHGRSFYVLDNIAALRQYTPAIASSPDPYLFRPATAIRSGTSASIQYWLKRPAQSIKVEVTDAAGRVAFSVTGPPSNAAQAGGRAGGGFGRGGRGGFGGGPSTAAGFHTVSWNLDYPDATTFPGMILWGASTSGPAAVPGTYQVHLTVDGRTQTQPLTIIENPLYKDVTLADLEAQFALGIRIRDKLSEANQAVIRIRDIKGQVKDRLGRTQDAKAKQIGDRLSQQISGVEEEIYQVRNQSGQDPLNFPIKINNRLGTLNRSLNTGDGRPIQNIEPIFNDLSAELKVQTDALERILNTELPRLNAELRRLGLQEVNSGRVIS